MIKTLHIVTTVVAAFIISLFFIPDQDVTVVMSALDAVVPGQEFEVEVTLNKGNIEGYARLQQKLPEGFTATPVFMGNAKFTFEDQYVKLVWFALPDEAAPTILYRIKVDNNISADTKTIAGIFSYIEKDKTKTIDVRPIHIKISKDQDAVASSAKQGATATEDPAMIDPVQIERNIPDHVEAGKDFIVELTVRNTSIHGSAKIVEHIPEGWVAEKGLAKGALFKVQDSLVKFIWVNMPKDTVLKLSYHLKPGKNVKNLQNIYGTFAFEYKGIAHSFDYFPSQIVLVESEHTVAVVPKNTPDLVGAAIKESLKPEQPAQEVLTAQATSVSSPETGIMYKVQIAACRRDVKDVHYFNQHYHIGDPVAAEMDNGWHKYVIGSFNEYRNAHDMRLTTNEKVNGAFVVAYNNGVRIPVREALNVSKQKWLQ